MTDERKELTASEIIDAVKHNLSIESDYKLEQILGLNKKAIYQARRNGGNTVPWKLLRLLIQDNQ